MRVYARYFTDDGLNYRRNTILQLGDSWEVIGAAVLINPGSAAPIAETDEQTTEQLRQITGIATDWKTFSTDSTMRQLEKVFNGSYINKQKTLDGVIMLFNLFNLRDQRLEEAVKQMKDCKSCNLFSEENDLQLMKGVGKIYLGWGETGKRELREQAEKIFNNLTAEQKSYLKPKFEENPFYHPGFINRSYKRFKVTQEILENFSAKE
jgi:hypothetical protein